MVDHELDELRREFLAEAGEKVDEMQGVVDGERNLADLERLAYLAHQLKGSGGSYGYQQISTDAAELEKAVEGLDGASPTEEFLAGAQRHVMNLRNEIARALAELS